MRIAVITVIGALALIQVAVAQDASDKSKLEELCRTVLCRTPASIQLRLSDGETFQMTPEVPTPIVVGNLITVYPGETVMAEARVEEQRLVDLKAVANLDQPERTLVLHLKQELSIGDGTGMLLTVKSPFPGVLKYSLDMMLLSGDIQKTSVCPLRAGAASFEHWPHPIFQVLATDFRFVDPESESATTCE